MMILHHHDMVKPEYTQNMLPFVFYLNTPNVLLHLLYMVQKQHYVYFHMSHDIFDYKALYPSIL